MDGSRAGVPEGRRDDRQAGAQVARQAGMKDI